MLPMMISTNSEAAMSNTFSAVVITEPWIVGGKNARPGSAEQMSHSIGQLEVEALVPARDDGGLIKLRSPRNAPRVPTFARGGSGPLTQHRIRPHQQ